MSNIRKILLLIKDIFKRSPILILIGIGESIFQVLDMYIPLLILPPILKSIYNKNAMKFILFGSLYFVGIELFQLIFKYLSGKRSIISQEINGKWIDDIYLKPLKMDFEDTIKGEFRNKYSRAIDEVEYECDYNDIISKLQLIIFNIISSISALGILCFMIFTHPKTGSKLMKCVASPWFSVLTFLLIIIVSIYLVQKTNKKIDLKQREYFEGHASIERKLSYYMSNIINNFSDYGIYRIYNMNPFLCKNIDTNANENIMFFKKSRKLNTIKDLCSGIAIGIFTIFAYIIVGVKILTKSFGVELLFTYVYSVINFSQSILNLFNYKQYLMRQLPYFEDLFGFLSIKEEDEGKGKGEDEVKEPLKNGEDECNWEFINVSYKYPEQSDNVVSNLNFKIEGNKKHALVGKNGAGKSTLILLLLGILKPTEGEILFNGQNLRKLNMKDYRKKLSIVFQKFTLLPTNIVENVACSNEYNTETVLNCLSSSGFHVDSSENILKTNVYNQSEDGHIFSGGEIQKIAIAKALYKQSLCFIADEPTAALDPLSEAQIYQKLLYELVNRSVIFISHRMSSCKDCDDIIVMDNGTIVQRGNHNKLLNEKGIYNILWEKQSKYYR